MNRKYILVLFILFVINIHNPKVHATNVHDPSKGDWVYVSSECRFPGMPTEPDGQTRIVGDYSQRQRNSITLGNMGTYAKGTSPSTASNSYHDYSYSYITCNRSNLEDKCLDIICGNAPWLFVDASQKNATSYYNDDCGCNTAPALYKSYWWIGTRQKIYGNASLYKWKSNCIEEYNELLQDCGSGNNIIGWSNDTCSGLCRSKNLGLPCPESQCCEFK